MARVNLSEMAESISPHAAVKPAALGLLAALAEPPSELSAPTMAPLTEVDPHPGNVRAALGDLTELADSIRAVGVIQPLVVVAAAVWNGANPDAEASAGRYVVIAGHRRLAAAALAGLVEVPIVVRDELADPQAATTAMLIENIHRQNLAPLDEATAMAALSKAGMGQREIAARTGISQATVSKRIALLGLTETGQQAIRDETLTPDVALELLKLPRSRQDAVLRRGIAYGNVRGAISGEREVVSREKRRQKIVDDLEAAGVTVVADAAAHIGDHEGSIYERHYLVAAEDIAAAKAAGLAFATADSHGYVTWWCTAAAPWPWQEQPSASDSDRITHRSARPREAAKVARTRAIAEYLAAPTEPAALLAELVLIGAHYTDTDLVATYLGLADADHVAVALASIDPAERLRAAIAIAAADLERDVTRGDTYESITAGGRDYIDVLERRAGYVRAAHETPPADAAGAGDGANEGSQP